MIKFIGIMSYWDSSSDAAKKNTIIYDVVKYAFANLFAFRFVVKSIAINFLIKNAKISL